MVCIPLDEPQNQQRDLVWNCGKQVNTPRDKRRSLPIHSSYSHSNHSPHSPSPFSAEENSDDLKTAVPRQAKHVRVGGIGARFRVLASQAPPAVQRQLTPRVTLVEPESTPITETASDKVEPAKLVDSANTDGSDDSAELGHLANVAEAPLPEGHGVHPKFLSKHAFRARLSEDGDDGIAERLKAMGDECTPLCSPRRLDRRRKKRALKRIQPQMQAAAKPVTFVLHPPCLVSTAIYSSLQEQYRAEYARNLQCLYKEQLEKEVNIDRCRTRRARSQRRSPQLHGGNSGLVTGKFSNSPQGEDTDEPSIII